MKTLICGGGEIGKALAEVLVDYKPAIIDVVPERCSGELGRSFDILHIAFPYSDDFEEQVADLKVHFLPKFVVIHSTVEIGTSKKLDAIFSPVVGLHPHLAESLRIFPKYLAGKDASEVADYFRRVGMKVKLFDNSDALELAKLSQTTFYALMIEYIKDLKKKCDELGVSFHEVYTIPSTDYNNGYEQLGYPEFKMPLLQPIMKRQGGHCTRRNCDLWESPFTEFIKKMNDGYSEAKTA